jgi:hypothetical protein
MKVEPRARGPASANLQGRKPRDVGQRDGACGAGTIERAPRFDHGDLFDSKRIRLADIDGSGTADILYFVADRIH